MESARGNVLTTREFLNGVGELARMQLPLELRDCRVVGPLSALIKIHYGNPSIHYEVWVRRKIHIVEVGLHFEGLPEMNRRYLDELLQNNSKAIASLRPKVKGEHWGRAWTRIHSEFSLGPLDEDAVMEISANLAQMMRILEPLIRGISKSLSRVQS